MPDPFACCTLQPRTEEANRATGTGEETGCSPIVGTESILQGTDDETDAGCLQTHGGRVAEGGLRVVRDDCRRCADGLLVVGVGHGEVEK